ncbi:MAG: HrgA protein [Oscillospiraceae bacterium]|nr:HrgA protein [Oscillospiraceae bacterium]
MTFVDLIYETLSKHQAPLTAQEIWDKAEEYGIRKNFSSSGKTPVATLSARLYVDIKQNPDTPFYQHSKRPATFYLKGKEIGTQPRQQVAAHPVVPSSAYNERDLHPLLVSFVYSDTHFRCMAKTIYHEKSKRGDKGKYEWLHPDIVGIHFPKQAINPSTYDLMQVLGDCQYKLYSFEMKKRVDFATLREYFFQAVSNSSWANEGYLVALEYADSTELQEEMRRLNNAFGIGFIRLNPENIEQSEILFSAHYKENVDWDTIDRLSDTNRDFNEFVTKTVRDIRGSGEPHPSDYDTVLTGEQIENYSKQHKMI